MILQQVSPLCSPLAFDLSVPGIILLGDSSCPIPYSLIHMLDCGTPSPILSFRKLLSMLQNPAVKLSLTVPGPV